MPLQWDFTNSAVRCLTHPDSQVLWGPLSFVVAWYITKQHPLRYPLQALVSIGQIYGDILYYATSMFDHYHKGLTYCRPEGYYFWCYYFFMNFIWIVIPGCKSFPIELLQPDPTSLFRGLLIATLPTDLLYQSIDATAKAFRALDKMSKSLQGNGNVKKIN